MKQTDMKQSSKVKTRPVLFLVVALLAGMLALMGTPAAHAAVGIVVNSNADDTVANDGACTLREAINNANSDSDTTGGDCAAGAGADSITFAADYTITLVGSQLPAVTGEMTITGNGAANTIIQADAAPDTATYRVLQVASTGNLTLYGVTVRHGHCAGSCATYGGVGGGILNYGGTLTVTDSTLSHNSASGFGGGGGIANASYRDQANSFHRAMLTVTGSALSGNSANGGEGGGISNSGTLSVTDSTLSGNSTNGSGGGIYNHASTLSVTDSTISGNTANTWGGGIASNGGTLTVTNSTLSGNSLTPSSVSGGGGIFNLYGTLTVTNSTLSGNSAAPSGGGGGGGIYSNGGTLTVTNSILSGNNSTTPSNVGGGDEVFNRSSITNASNVFGHSGQSNADAFYGFTPGASDFNATSDGLTPTALASILDTTLADNGGPTQTHALVAGSPAIDFAGACGLATDQRGVARPQGTACDAGAFELVTNQPPTAVAGGPYMVAVNASVFFDGSASSDPDLDTLTETWTANGGSVVGNTYMAGAVPGIYDVCLTVYDGTDYSDPDCTIVVVYDPSGGFVTGGGWIDSRVNTDYQYMQFGGKATFGFVAKYKKGANEPDGNTEFQFKTGDLNFHSTSYEWLVVAGNTAQFKGEGTINGQGPNPNDPSESYKFIIWADDDNPDTFRIKIWYEENGAEVVMYDNGSQQSLGGGSIVVHAR